MAILNIQPMQIGVSGVEPSILMILTNDVYATIIETGYLGTGQFDNAQFSKYQIAYVYTTNFGVVVAKVIESSQGLFSLTPVINTGSVIPPTVIGNIPFFGDTDGTMYDADITVSDIDQGVVASVNITTPPVSGDLPKFLDNNGTIGESGIAANTVLISSFSTPDANANLVSFSVTVGEAALASAGSVTLYTSSGSKQYRIINLFVNNGGTNFSGGSGDRLLSITDGTTVYSLVPAASLQTLANTGWGVTGLPYPASAAIDASTVAGASLVAKYSGGTLDYTAGSVVISGILQRIA